MLRTVSQRAWSVARRQAVWRPSAVSVRCMADEADGGAVAADNEVRCHHPHLLRRQQPTATAQRAAAL